MSAKKLISKRLNLSLIKKRIEFNREAFFLFQGGNGGIK